MGFFLIQWFRVDVRRGLVRRCVMLEIQRALWVGLLSDVSSREDAKKSYRGSCFNCKRVDGSPLRRRRKDWKWIFTIIQCTDGKQSNTSVPIKPVTIEAECCESWVWYRRITQWRSTGLTCCLANQFVTEGGWGVSLVFFGLSGPLESNPIHAELDPLVGNWLFFRKPHIDGR